MSTPEDSGSGEFNDAALERQLRKLRPVVPLTREELETLRKMLDHFKYEEQRRAEFKARWPMVALIVSTAMGLLGIVMAWLSKGGAHP